MNNPHGEASMKVTGKILVIDTYGAFNREGAKRFSNELRNLVNDQLVGNSWAILGILHEEIIHPPETIEELKELHIWRVQNGLRHLALVHRDIVKFKLYQDMYAGVFEKDIKSLCATQFFQSKAEAETWLSNEGY
jgi:hypothetical protein